MSTTPPLARRTAAVVLSVLVALVGTTALAGPAWAHGGPGKLEVVSTEPQADGTSVKVTVQLNFAEDGDPAADATVTVVGELEGGAGATEFTPVTLAASGPEGQYSGVVPIPGPGTWNLRVTSVEPPATATTQVSTAATTRTEVSSTAPPTTAAATPTTEQATSTEPAEDGPNLLVRGVMAGAVVGAVAAVVVALRRRRAVPSTGTGPDGPTGA